MKRNHRFSIIFRLCTLVFALMMVFILPINALAESITVIRPIDVINRYRPNDEIVYSIVRQIDLKSISNGYDYTLYELSPYGYAILFKETNSLMEACYSENAMPPVCMTDNCQYYYGGPNIYCSKNDNGYLNMWDNCVLQDDELASVVLSESSVQNSEMLLAESVALRSNENVVMSRAAATTNNITYSVQYSYFSSLVNYGTNVQGTCTVLACAMLLGYYDNYANEGVVATNYESGNGTSEAFHQLLNTYVYGENNYGGIFIRNAAAGINDYFDDQGLLCTLQSEYISQSSAVSTMISNLQSGHPVIASMAVSMGAPYNHSVLVYSVTYDSTDPISSSVFTVNMGWHSGTIDGQSKTEYVLAGEWLYECGYIVNECDTHNYISNWLNYNEAYHYRYCVHCTETILDDHFGSWDYANAKCTLCGRRGFCLVPA